MLYFRSSTKQSSASSEKKKTTDQTKLSDEPYDTPDNEPLMQTNIDESTFIEKDESSSNTNKGSSVYTSLSHSYSTELYANEARRISEQIKEDKKECRFVIAQYGVDPNELLHLLGQWTQHIIFEYKQRRERFKLILKEKWERGELNGMKSDDDSNCRLVHVHVQKLNEWLHTGLATMKRQLEELQPTNNVKDMTNQFIDELLQIMSSVIIIHQSITTNNNSNRSKTINLSTYLNEIIEHLKHIKKINEKEHSTICIIGLEKAGKSSFINALLGFELLPFKIERCTQIQTILRPLSKQTPNLFATIEFYSQNEFSTLMDNLPKEKDETEDAYQDRIKSIRQIRQDIIPSDTLIQNYQISNENDRQKITQTLHEYIANELYINIVKHVIIYTNKLPGENYTLLDVPGCDSPMIEHRSSAINAVQNADAFLYLTDGQRPSLTNDQLRLLNEIQEGHFDGMKRAFGIITKLDLCQTRAKYREHRAKTQSELERQGFLTEHIFTVAANISLLEQTKSDMDHLKKLKEHINQYDSLIDGFDKCKQSLNDYIEYKLPHSRFRQIVSIAQQKIFRYVQDALKLGRQLIPIDIEQISLDDYIKQIHTEKWDEIFDKERYKPVLARASRWQKETLAIKKKECTQTLMTYFHDQFQACTEDIVSKYHPIERVMLEQHDISVFQMNPYDIETKEREKIVEDMLKVVKNASNELAIYMYDKYVNELEKILNDICPEQCDLFQSGLTMEHCAIEVRTLILRVAHPVIIATIRWPHVYNDNRIEAAKDLARIAPTIAFNICENSQTVSNDNTHNLSRTMGIILKETMGNNTQIDMLMALFRR